MWLLLALMLGQSTTYHLTVLYGSGSGDYLCGQAVTITAGHSRARGQELFEQWFPGWDGDTSINRITNRRAVLTMPCKDVTVEARFTAAPPRKFWR